MSLLTLGLSASLAWAGGVVVYEGSDAAPAVDRVDAASDHDPSALRPVSTSELGAALPLGVAALVQPQACATPRPRTSDLALALERAEGLLNYGQVDQALTPLREAREAVACLDAPADRGTVARLLFVLGVAEFRSGDPRAAQHAFEGARSFEPTMTWDPNYAPRHGQDVFEATRLRTLAPATLRLVAFAGGCARVDGGDCVAGDVAVAAGRHLVQAPSGAGWLDVPAGQVVAMLVDAPATTGLRDGATWEGWSALAGGADWLTVSGRVWRHDAPGAWSEVPVPGRERRRWVGGATGGVGIAALVAGGALTSLSVRAANEAVGACLDAAAAGGGADGCAAERAQYDAAVARLPLGWGLLAGGTVLFAGGVVVWPWSAGVTPPPVEVRP